MAAAKKLEATMGYSGSICIGEDKYSFKKGAPFEVKSQKHLDVIESEQKRRDTLAKG